MRYILDTVWHSKVTKQTPIIISFFSVQLFKIKIEKDRDKERYSYVNQENENYIGTKSMDKGRERERKKGRYIDREIENTNVAYRKKDERKDWLRK